VQNYTVLASVLFIGEERVALDAGGSTIGGAQAGDAV
jgi:hypothetical protein